MLLKSERIACFKSLVSLILKLGIVNKLSTDLLNRVTV